MYIGRRAQRFWWDWWVTFEWEMMCYDALNKWEIYIYIDWKSIQSFSEWEFLLRNESCENMKFLIINEIIRARVNLNIGRWGLVVGMPIGWY